MRFEQTIAFILASITFISFSFIAMILLAMKLTWFTVAEQTIHALLVCMMLRYFVTNVLDKFPSKFEEEKSDEK